MLSDIDWCEAKYTHTIYIAEIKNTLSSLIISAVALYGWMYHCPQPKYSLGWVLLVVVGLASAMFHATLLLFWQYVDELSIFALVLWLVANTQPPILQWYHWLCLPVLVLAPFYSRYVLFLLGGSLIVQALVHRIQLPVRAAILLALGVVVWLVDINHWLCLHDWWHIFISFAGFLMIEWIAEG